MHKIDDTVKRIYSVQLHVTSLKIFDEFQWNFNLASMLKVVRKIEFWIFWEVVGLERVPLSLVNTIEELLGRNNSGSGLENREYGRVDLLHWPHDTVYPQKLALTSPTSDSRSVGIVRLWTKATEFFFFFCKECVLDIKYISHYAYSYYFSHFYVQGVSSFDGTVNLYLQLNVTDYAVICFCWWRKYNMEGRLW
jgi:hypothetical protein